MGAQAEAHAGMLAVVAMGLVRPQRVLAQFADQQGSDQRGRGLPFKANCTIQYSAGQATIQGKYPFKIDYHGKPRRQGNYTLDRNFLRWAQMALTTPSQT